MDNESEWFICRGCKGKCSMDMESDEDLTCQDCFDGSWDGETEYLSNREQDNRDYNEMRYQEARYYANQYRN